jgi:hypothetical protein
LKITSSRIIWGEAETDLLISERKRRNYEYHYTFRRNKTEFWESVGRRIYRKYGKRYTARQCDMKWKNLVRDYGVSNK